MPTRATRATRASGSCPCSANRASGSRTALPIGAARTGSASARAAFAAGRSGTASWCPARASTIASATRTAAGFAAVRLPAATARSGEQRQHCQCPRRTHHSNTEATNQHKCGLALARFPDVSKPGAARAGRATDATADGGAAHTHASTRAFVGRCERAHKVRQASPLFEC